MSPEKVKALLPVFTAFAHGKIIQLQNVSGSWQDIDNPDFSGDRYRVKPDPKILKYRRYIWADNNGNRKVASLPANSTEIPSSVEIMPCFVRWIDNDWISYECDV